MSIARFCEAIESHEMAARLNVASNLRVAVEFIRTHPIVRKLAKELKNPGVAEHILRRVFELTDQAIDVRYENPNDVALMIYTWVLYRYDPLLASMASAAISQVPNLWWASKVATQIIDHRLEQNEMAGAVSTPVKANTQAGDRLFATKPSFSFPTRIRFIGRPTTLTLREHSGARTMVLRVGQLPLFPPRLSGFSMSAQTGDTAQLECIGA